MSIVFEAEPLGECDLRLGTFRAGRRTLKTPYFFPVMNVITGPPTEPSPLFANGGLWKWLKRLTLSQNVHVEGAAHQPALPGFLNQVLHFLDYNISPPMLKRWLPPGSRERIPTMVVEELENLHGADAAPGRPFVFLDSGGFQLLDAQRIDLSRYGLETKPRDILDLQLRFGGDFIATLDYPVKPGTDAEEARVRFKQSRKNALETLKRVHAEGIEDKMVFLAVHGRTEKEAYDYTRTLLGSVAKSPGRNVPHGLALGSLVPLNGSPRALLHVVAGAMRALREAPGADPQRTPVHAFGVSSTVAPYLCFLGVDTYDGFSYAKAAHNLTYYQPRGFSPQDLNALEDLACDCAGCILMKRGRLTLKDRTLHGLEAVKHAVSDAEKSHSTYFDWKDGYADTARIPPRTKAQKAAPESCGVGVPKSYFYALIALHNLSSNRHQISRLHRGTKEEETLRVLVEESEKGPKRGQILRGLCDLYPEVAPKLRAWGLAALVQPEQASLDRFAAPKKPKKGAPRAQAPPARLNPALGPESFNVLETSYRIPKGAVVLLLPCTKTKPYRLSSTHRLVEQALAGAGVDRRRIEKVSISGNYGPVPADYEETPNVLTYDFLLHETNEARIDLLAERLRLLLVRDRERYRRVIAYATQRPYRRVLKKALQGLPRCALLPEPLKSHTAAQFRAKANLEQLAREVRAAVDAGAVLEARNR